MTNLLECREWLKTFYGKYTVYVDAGIRFLTGLMVFLLITFQLGFFTRLRNPVVAILLALVCTFLPVNVMIIFAAALIILHASALSLEIALVMLVLSLVVYLVYYRFSPKYGYVILLTPLAMALKIPCVVPVVLGLVAAPVAAVPMLFGTLFYQLLEYISRYGESAASGADVKKIAYVFSDALQDPKMAVFMLVFTLTLVLVYLIRRSSIDQAWMIAIFSGVATQLILLLIGILVLDISVGVIALLVGSVLSCIVAFGLQFFVFQVDYTRTEYVQYEDDEYYYYVKAVPKVSIAKRQKTVKHINPQKTVRAESVKHKSKLEVQDIE